MAEAICSSRQTGNRAKVTRFGSARGFSLVELMFAILVGIILTAMAVPQIGAQLTNYRLQGAIASATWAVHSTRYQALMEGYPFQVVFNSTANTYQIQSSPANNGTYTNVDTAVPLSGSQIVLSADTTLNFKQNGYVSAPVGALNFTITYKGVCQKLAVTNYGNVSITPPYPQPTCP